MRLSSMFIIAINATVILLFIIDLKFEIVYR